MGFQDIILGCSGGYQRLRNDGETAELLPSRSTNTIIFRLISVKNSTWRHLTSILWLGTEISPAIVFSLQWGLPVLTHSSFVCKKSVEKSLYKKAF